MATVLQQIIDRWHEAHPDFVAVLPCVVPEAVTLPVAPRSVTVTAARLGISIREYRARQAAGERWCSWGNHWASDWYVNGRRTVAYCPEHMRPYNQEAARLRRERRAS